ncbi:MAG TPA: molybdenum cofactor guanylyltransferase [Chthoniobacteraceae bacterium]|nr:molybdenum cofactor guanylyltransferase [Chthoniobacteraceae bacterium]
MQSDTAAAILGGGAGSRIGGRKALVMLEGEPLVAHVARSLRASAGQLALVGDAEAAGAIHADALSDPANFPAGPLSGVCAALEWAARGKAAFVAIAPCDTPLLTPDVMAELREAVATGVNVACAETQDGPQPLISVWRTSIAPWLRNELAGGHPSVRDVLTRIGFRAVRFAEADVFLNVNTPEDLQRAQAIIRARR